VILKKEIVGVGRAKFGIWTNVREEGILRKKQNLTKCNQGGSCKSESSLGEGREKFTKARGDSLSSYRAAFSGSENIKEGRRRMDLFQSPADRMIKDSSNSSRWEGEGNWGEQKKMFHIPESEQSITPFLGPYGRKSSLRSCIGRANINNDAGGSLGRMKRRKGGGPVQ